MPQVFDPSHAGVSPGHDAASTPWPAPGCVLDGRYLIERCVGEGSSGRVYAALHLGLRTSVAVKLLRVLDADAPAQKAFRREAETLGRLAHPHVVRVLDFGVERESGRAYLAMELLRGRTLSEHLRAAAALPQDKALDVLDQVARALDAAHAAGILHRDVKPANVWLDEQGHVKVMDFGLAGWLPAGVHGIAEGSSELTAGVLGTPLYASPEVLGGAAASVASDVYSYGVMAYELLTAQAPFRGSLREVAHAHQYVAVPPGPGLPDPLQAALARLLAKRPQDRPPSVGAAFSALRGAVQQVRRAHWQRRRVRASLALTAALLAVSLGLPQEVFPAVERRWHDLRLSLASPREPDPRILLVALEPQPPGSAEATLAERGDEIAEVLAGMLAAGARGVALDVLLPGRWSASPAFSRLALTSGDTLTLAAYAGPDGRLSGADALAGLTAVALGPRHSTALFGLVNQDEDDDGVVRRGRRRFRVAGGELLPSWATRAASALRPPPPTGEASFWIDCRLDERRLERLAWPAARLALVREPQRFHGRLVLVGADWAAGADDAHRVPGRIISGLELQALQVATLLAGAPLRSAPLRPCAALLALVAGVAFYAGLGASRALGYLAPWLAAALVWLTGSVSLLLASDLLVPATTPLVVLALGALGLWIGRGRLRQPLERD